MPLSPGTRIGPYEILAPIGAGGMGEVYRGRDTKLDREVAIKVLPAAFAQHPERLARFEREAKVLASLNHPNIATIYAVEESPEGKALVMELVKGQTLKGPVPVDTALKYAAQIASALDAAHEKGITHRDLKPANIMVTPDGTIKVLDFGLAAVTQLSQSEGEIGTNMATLTMSPTSAGMIMGTAAYMSPEQASGQTVDRRADIWSFGVVLWELLTGKQLFGGTTVSHILASVLKDEPDFTQVPYKVRRLLRRCLEKDPQKRLWHIGAAMELVEVDAEAVPVAATAPQSRFGKLPWIAAAVLAIVAAGASWIAYRATRPAELKPLVRLDVDLGADVALPATNYVLSVTGSNVAISPDGTRLVYASGNPTKLFTRRLDQPTVTELPGTDGGFAPFFSPDGQWLGFRTATNLNKISVEGGALVPLGQANNLRGASWGEDGNIFLGVQGTGLLRIRDSGGASEGPPETVAALGNGEVGLGFPQILPGGKAILFSAYTAENGGASSIEVLTLADHHRRTVSRGGTSPHYLATSNGAGFLVYVNKATLFAVPFDLEKLETRGTALPIVDDVASDGTVGTAQFSFSRTGTLVYRRGGEDAGLLTVQWLDGAGKTQPLLAKLGNYGRPSLSPDSQRLALEVTEGSGTDIWVYDWRRETMTRLTFTGNNFGPIWSPDGRYIVFRTGNTGMSATRSDGAVKPRPLTQGKNVQYPWSFTPDGKRLAFQEQDSKTSYDLWSVPIESDGAGLRSGKPEVFLQTPAIERYPCFSPDGRWLAYVSSESGTLQVYVRAFPDKGGKWQISNTGGGYPMWSRNGRELFFETLDNHIMVAAYSVKGDSFVPDKPQPWSEKQIGGAVGNTRNVDLAPDGKRIVALMPATEAKGAQEAQNHVVFLENFLDELQRKFPVGK